METAPDISREQIERILMKTSPTKLEDDKGCGVLEEDVLDHALDDVKVRVVFPNYDASPIEIELPRSKTIAAIRSILPLFAKKLAIRHSGVYLTDKERLDSLGRDRILLCIEKYPKHHCKGVKLIGKNLLNELMMIQIFPSETLDDFFHRLHVITGIPTQSLWEVRLNGIDITGLEKSMKKLKLKENHVMYFNVEKYISDVSIGRGDGEWIRVQLKSGYHENIFFDPNDPVRFFFDKLRTIDLFKPIQSSFYSMTIGPSLVNVSCTLIENGYKKGAEIMIPVDHVPVTMEERRKEITLILKFLDCAAMFVSIHQDEKLQSFVERLRKIPCLEKLDTSQFDFYDKTISCDGEFWEQKIEHGDVIFARMFLPEGATLPGMFYHTDMTVQVICGNTFNEIIHVHSTDSMKFLCWILYKIPEVKKHRIYDMTYDGKKVVLNESFIAQGIRDGAIIEVPT
eukprot:TRINITY_DN2381_c0_g1_i1.p1 TRINITY_DN2381_c0_g1~~TRINITY_DN2381_c0_g1_i1.p1  ORF type:complete len:455 (+),score=110.50 TRINITY_DN2381_c0_g1_i1:571-1935(+)